MAVHLSIYDSSKLVVDTVLLPFFLLLLIFFYLMLNFQEELSGSGTVVIRSPRGYQASTQFHNESSPV